jgi:hypothetical protein
MFPQVAPKFFAKRSQGPLNLGKDPNAAPPPRSPAVVDTGTGPVRTPIAYEVTLNGKTHKVTSRRRSAVRPHAQRTMPADGRCRPRSTS